MNKKNISEKIEIAKKLVEGTDEKFRVAAFSAVLTRLLMEETSKDGKKTMEMKPYVKSEGTVGGLNMQKKKEEFAAKCAISLEELDKTLDIRTEYVQLLKSIKGGEASKQRLASKCILTAFLEIYQKDWVDSDTLVNSLEKSGVSSNTLPRNLRQEPESFSIKGSGSGSTLEYAITGPAKVATYDIIKKLAKGENLE